MPNFDVNLAEYKNFGGVKTIWDRENTTTGRKYQKMKKIIGGLEAALKSA